MNGLPIKSAESVRDDAVAMGVLAAARVTITPSVIRGLEQWFGDVEVLYPIPVMDLTSDEKYDLLHTVCCEIAQHFNELLSNCNGDVIDDEALSLIAGKVDPLWREVTGILSTELNERFESQRVPDDNKDQVIQMIKYSVSESGDLDDPSVNHKLKSDPEIRTHLRRLGIDPDII